MAVFEQDGLLKFMTTKGTMYCLRPATAIDKMKGIRGQAIIISAVNNAGSPTACATATIPTVAVDGETLIYRNSKRTVDGGSADDDNTGTQTIAVLDSAVLGSAILA